jgi:hypothetical protein
MLPHIALALWLKSCFEKMMCGGLILYALRHKENVAAKYGHGTFEIVATGERAVRRLE